MDTSGKTERAFLGNKNNRQSLDLYSGNGNNQIGHTKL